MMSNGRVLCDGHGDRLRLQPLGGPLHHRWQTDPTEDRMGSYIFLRDAGTGDWWSATAEPKARGGRKAQTLFSDDKASFLKIGRLPALRG